MDRWKYFYLYSCAVLVAFICVAYELLLASYATFLMGASIFQYSLVISLMMFSMGLGALIAKPISKNNFETFLAVELILAWCAIIAVPLMYLSFCLNFAPTKTLIFFVFILGLGIGMEVPLLSEIARTGNSLSYILFSDYLGGFIGGIVFPILLFPHFGFFQVGSFLGLLSGLISVSFVLVFGSQINSRKPVWFFLALMTLTFCLTELFYAEQIRTLMEKHFFGISPN